jgi:hypothetical protein
VTYAADGVVMVQTVTSGTNVMRSEVQLEPTRMRTEVTDPAGRRQTVIYDGGKDVLYVVDTARKSYMEMTRADAERMGTAMRGAMAAIQQQLASLPPEQRAALEKKMGALAGLTPDGGEKPVFRRNGTDRVGEWTCDKYDGFTKGEKTTEVCTVDPKVLGLTVADFAVTLKMAEFAASIMPQMANQMVGIGSPEQGFSGVPVRAISGPEGNNVTVVLTEVRRTTFADEIFAIPAGFQKQAIPALGAGMPQR